MRKPIKPHPLMKGALQQRDRQVMKEVFSVLYEDSPINRKIQMRKKCPIFQEKPGLQMVIIFNHDARQLYTKPPF